MLAGNCGVAMGAEVTKIAWVVKFFNTAWFSKDERELEGRQNRQIAVLDGALKRGLLGCTVGNTDFLLNS